MEDNNDQVDQAYQSGFVTQSQAQYERLHFVNPFSFYDWEAPDVRITFGIGGALVFAMLVLWSIRFHEKKACVPADKTTPWTTLRAMISAAIDNDSPIYTIVKISAQSMMFLGGIQIDYHFSFVVMLIFFTVESSLDTFRTVLCVSEYDNPREVVLTSADLKKDIHTDIDITQLQPKNVYEDLTRVKYVVVMVFITQLLLISFVVVDIMNSSTHACPDGTAGCPVGGTLGSWLFYCLGIFMASVVLLGPKTNFGESEQNPAFWMQLLLALKANKGHYVQWTDAKTGHKEMLFLHHNDWRVWMRFAMSFIINGIGFHILVFALPIQIAAQSSLTGVVFRAVGMLYLVDLDDSAGYTLTFVKKPQLKEEEGSNQSGAAPDENTALLEKTALADEADAILREAHAKLDALAASSGL